MDLFIYQKLASYDYDIYCKLITAIPTFARYMRNNNYRFLKKEFVTVTDLRNKLIYLFNGAKYMVKSHNKKCITWYKNGLIHRDNDLPAFVGWDCGKYWKSKYKKHINGEASLPNELRFCKIWYKNGLIHRDNDLPAIIYDDNGHFVWFQHGKIHRDNDLPAEIIYNNKLWYKDNLIHRDNDEPAVVTSIRREWRQYGLFHRNDNKPAIILSNGLKIWYIEGRIIRSKY